MGCGRVPVFRQQAHKTHNATPCHSERSVSEVEESTHDDNICTTIGAKILRLASLAQDDRIVLCCFCAGIDGHRQRQPSLRQGPGGGLGEGGSKAGSKWLSNAAPRKPLRPAPPPADFFGYFLVRYKKVTQNDCRSGIVVCRIPNGSKHLQYAVNRSAVKRRSVSVVQK